MAARSAVECFMVVRTGVAEQSLRRFATRGEPCPLGSHSAKQVIGEVPWVDEVARGYADDSFPHTDPMWPKHCQCGYRFRNSDEWQHTIEQKYARKDAPTVTFILNSAPPGAMWDAYWCPEEWQGGDGIILSVRLPDGSTFVNDGQWTRVGILPKVTLHPSIHASGWHGFLRHGYLIPAG